MATPRLPLSWSQTATRCVLGVKWAFVALGVVTLAAAVALSIGLSAIFWGPLLVLAGGAMWTVWAARRRRQIFEGRDRRDVKDAQQAPRQWPTAGVTDDRLPEP